MFNESKTKKIEDKEYISRILEKEGYIIQGSYIKGRDYEDIKGIINEKGIIMISLNDNEKTLSSLIDLKDLCVKKALDHKVYFKEETEASLRLRYLRINSLLSRLEK